MQTAGLDSTARMNGWRRLANFLALRRNTCVLLGALILMGTGEKLWIGFVPKYLEVLGAGIFIIGLFDALQTLLGAVYAYPGGWLDRPLGPAAFLAVLQCALGCRIRHC